MSIAKKILILSTYPIKNPQHGGQKRLAAIANEYTKAGFVVKSVAIFNPSNYKDYTSDDIQLNSYLIHEVNKSPFTGDIISGDAIFEDAHIRKQVMKVLNTFKPDIIHIEQAFPYLGLRPLLNSIGFRPKVVFGSQNVEYTMKEEMLNSLSYPSEFTRSITKKIYDIEVKLSCEADLVAAVSADDLRVHEKMGATHTVLAPNGIYRSVASDSSVSFWKQTFGAMGVNKIILFVGSAHPPNWIGFQDMAGMALGFIPRDTRIVFAGSISEYAQHELGKLHYDIGAATFEKRAYFAGRLSEDRLAGLLHIADEIILPITEGGGSNLKTAEAILSDKAVVATSYAFRGYEQLKNISGVFIADNKNDFRRAMLEALRVPNRKRTPEERHKQEAVVWDNCLRDLVEKVKQL